MVQSKKGGQAARKELQPRSAIDANRDIVFVLERECNVTDQ